MHDTHWITKYDWFLSLGSWVNAFFVGIPAAVLLAAMSMMNIDAKWWTPVLIVYAISALGYCLNYGFMAVNIQMKVIADNWTKEGNG